MEKICGWSMFIGYVGIFISMLGMVTLPAITNFGITVALLSGVVLISTFLIGLVLELFRIMKLSRKS